MARCNLNIEERARIMKDGPWGRHDSEEMDELRHLFQQHIFIRKYEDGVEWHCSACQTAGWEEKQEKNLYRRKHKDVTKCPHCDHVVTVRNLGKIKTGANLHEAVAVNFVNVDEAGAVYIESGIGFWDFNLEDGMDELFAAKRRYYLAPGKVMCWKRSLNWDLWSQNYHPSGWEAMASITEPFSSNWCYGFDGFSNFIGLEKLGRSALKYSAIDQYFSDYHSLDIWEYQQPLRLVQKYLAEYAMRPVIEMAVKMGHSDMVGPLVRDGKANAKDLNWRAKNPADFCRLTKAEYKQLSGLDLEGLKLYHSMKESGMVHRPQDMLLILENIGTGMLKRTVKACEGLNVEITEAARYLGKQKAMQGLWLDYIDMARKLGYDLTDRTVMFPKNLAERHDAAGAMMKSEADERAQKAYKKRRAELTKRYSFHMDGLQIVVPGSAAEIVAEGKTLHHCVGGYADRHVQGKTVILFLRKERKPNTPYLTIELDTEGNMKQIHGYKNERYPHAVDPRKTYAGFIAAWQGWYRRGSKRDENGQPIVKEIRSA